MSRNKQPLDHFALQHWKQGVQICTQCPAYETQEKEKQSVSKSKRVKKEQEKEEEKKAIERVK